MVCLVLKWFLSTAWRIHLEQASSKSGNKENSKMAQCPQSKRNYGDFDVGGNGKTENKFQNLSIYALKLRSTEVLID